MRLRILVRLALLYVALQVVLSGCGGCDEASGKTTNNAVAGDAGDAFGDGSVGCVDADGDGFSAGGACQDQPLDCDDTDASVAPGADEVCGDGIDNNCDGQVDEDCPSCTDGDTRACGSDVGACQKGTQTCQGGTWGECVGEVRSAPEVCDGVDNDCDGQVDEDPENALCDDGIKCNGVEVCNAGTCEAGQPVDCSQFDGPCQQGICQEKDGSCAQVFIPDGTACDDGQFCTVNGVCQEGVCQTEARDCSSASDQCNVGQCDEDADACVPKPVSDGTTCNDGAFCTVNDACQAGTCTGSARDCSAAGDQCNDGICDEQADSCVPQPVADDTPCDDGQYCTVNDTCQQGQCSAGGPRQCGAAGGSCRTGTCDEQADACTGDPVPDGTSCEDGQYCTVNDTCQAGTCAGGGARDCASAGDQCNDGACDEQRNRCAPTPKADGTTCNDGLFCTVGDQCTSGACGGSSRDCSSAGDQCNDGTCDDTQDSCVPSPKSDGTTCNDGLFCTVSDVCTGGACGGSARACAYAGDQCNDGVCDDSSDACVAQPKADGTTCNDTLFCTVNDQCTSGTCGGAARDCSGAGDQCNSGVCDDTADACVAQPVADGTSCNDGRFCTVSDQCASGTCRGLGRDCSSVADQCNDGVCDDSTGACVPQPKVDGTTCNDGQPCTVSDQCTSGTCGGSPKDCSALDDQCNTGNCDPNSGSCVAQALSDGTSCNDGQFCTVGDQCSSGVCGGSARDCSAVANGEACATGVCDESFDQCTKQYDTSCCDNTVDNDLDGYDQCNDCDDANGAVHPNATEVCNGVDDDCDGLIDEDFDSDGDGYATCSDDPSLRDCDDTNAGVNPGAAENCGVDGTGNGIDDDCDGYIDEGCNPCTTTDVDGDGYSQCDGDCNDTNPDVHPGATEVCDGLDNDCNTFTVKNCDVDDPCNFPSGTDVCKDDRICACIVGANGSCTGDYRCTTFCNWSSTGPIGDGCGADQTCGYDLLQSSNDHACKVTTATPGSLGGGEACGADSDCRSLSCTKLCRGAGCNQTYCHDLCASDAYCGTNAVCQIQRLSTNMDGQCWPAGGPFLGTSTVGQSCSQDYNCDHGFCLTDPNDASRYCTEACCKDADCPSGYTCSMQGDQIDTTYVYPDPRHISCATDSDCTGQGGVCYNNECAWRLVETSPMCVKDVSGQGARVAGQQCSQNSDCASDFCEKTLGICVSTCCNDAACPTGLNCEGQVVQTDDDRVSQIRVCTNISTDKVLERK